jgi:hypothetical protein
MIFWTAAALHCPGVRSIKESEDGKPGKRAELNSEQGRFTRDWSGAITMKKSE